MAYQQQQRQDVVALEKYSATLAAQTINWLTTDVAEGKIKAIPGYDAGTEITTAMLKLTQVKDRTGALALTVCTKESVISAIRDMAIQGLSMTRSQCYPIVYGNQLQIQRSYFGTLAVFGRMFPNLKVNVGLVHKGDEYEFGVDEITGCNYIVGVKSSLESLDSPIIAAYGSLIDKTTGEQVYSDVMTWKQIQTAWSHAKTDKVQKEFPDQMAKRTLINRLCKLYVNAFGTTDNSAMMDSFIRTTQNEYQEEGTQERESTKSEEDIRKMVKTRSQGSSGLKAILKKKTEDADEVMTKDTLSDANDEPQSDSDGKVEEFTDQAESNDSSESVALEDMGLFEEEELPEDEMENYDDVIF